MTDDVFGESQNLAVPTTHIINNGCMLFKSYNFFHDAKIVKAIMFSCSLESHLMVVVKTANQIVGLYLIHINVNKIR